MLNAYCRLSILPFAMLLAIAPCAVSQDERSEPFEPPLSGRPTRFNGAVGVFRVSTEAEPTSVQVEKPLRFIVRITASGKAQTPPARPDLAADPQFADAFLIEPAEPPSRETKHTWEFHYLLRPRSVHVKEVPEVAFCYFDPSFGSDARGYQTTYSEAIPITVAPASTDPPKVEGAQPAEFQEHLLQLERGEHVLRRDEPWQLPGATMLILLLLGPPIACAAWYVTWRRLQLDSAGQVNRRRSRAAKRALAALQSTATSDPDTVSDAVAQYLRERFGLSSMTPTPAEVQALLMKEGTSEQVCDAGRELFLACDAARYAPAGSSRGLTDQAAAFIMTVEAEPWS